MADLEKLCKNLASHGFVVSHFATGKEAVEHICSELHGKKIAFGGSVTVQELGLYDSLAADNEVVWHWSGDRAEMLEKALHSEVYILSANGVSETGELVNIDGTGNRLSASLFGRERVIFVIGANKVEPDLEKAIWRARNIAAPLNAKRLGMKTPCAEAAEPKCFDCSAPARICRGMVLHMRALKGVGVTEVVIVDEALGL